MKFVMQEKPVPRSPTFEDVHCDTFFVDHYGRLCHKIDGESYNIVTDKNGVPYADHVGDVGAKETVGKLLAKVVKIEY